MAEVIIRELEARGRKFVILRNDDGWYMAVEDKYITDGKINTTLNGFQMNVDKKIENCIENTIKSVDIDYLVSQGYDRMEAIKEVFGIE